MTATRYRSKFEARLAQTLGKDWQYESERLPYVISHNYTPDFINYSTNTIIEAKGVFLDGSAGRSKLIAVKKAYPQWRFVLCFQNPHLTLNKRSTTTYAQWAVKHGFEVMTHN